VFLPELCIRRPVLATVLSLTVVLLGVISFDRLSVREYPKIDPPVVSVRTVYKGASAQVIESQITQPLEDSISGIEGIRTVKSVSREEVSTIGIEFNLTRDPDAAANDVRDRVARARGRLPDEAEDSIVSKVEADAQAIMWIAFYSDAHSALEITDYADRNVADFFKTLPGVASVIIVPPNAPLRSASSASRARPSKCWHHRRAGPAGARHPMGGRAPPDVDAHSPGPRGCRRDDRARASAHHGARA